ncbi:hypothetical protein PVAP13_4KG193025, partial [Panicum virgatum]
LWRPADGAGRSGEAWPARRRSSPEEAKGSGAPSWRSSRGSGCASTPAPAATPTCRSACAAGAPTAASRASRGPPATSRWVPTGSGSWPRRGRSWAAGRELDILVNNAGQTMFRPVTETTAEDYARIMATNLESCFHLAQ